MDGDCADLPRLCDLADQFDAILIVDEAHATGVLGQEGTGLCEAQGVAKRIDIVISTASKALGSLGGLITARREIIATIINRARPFIFTTGAMPAQAAAITAALDLIRDQPWRRHRLQAMARTLRRRVVDYGFTTTGGELPIPIVPIIMGGCEEALKLAAHLEKFGIFAPAIRPPSVPHGSARVRLSLRADFQDSEIDQLANALSCW